MTYTAKLCSNTRDNHLSKPKALLVEITYEDGTAFSRDHVWINRSKLVTKIQPSNGRNKPITIQFTAKEEEYLSTDAKGNLTTKVRLSHVRNIHTQA